MNKSELLTPATFDTRSEAHEFAEKNGGIVKLGEHHGLGIYDYIVVPREMADEVLGHDEYQAMIDRLSIDGVTIPSFKFASAIVSAVVRNRAAASRNSADCPGCGPGLGPCVCEKTNS